MGHLIHPIAFRLGNNRSWEDEIYINNQYYPEIIHSLIKVRNYLVYFFTRKKLEKVGILYSHFILLKHNINFIVKIFFYHSYFETFVQKTIFNWNNMFFEFVREKYIDRWHNKSKPFIYNVKQFKWKKAYKYCFIVYIIYWLFFFKLNNWKKIISILIFVEKIRKKKKRFIINLKKNIKEYKLLYKQYCYKPKLKVKVQKIIWRKFNRFKLWNILRQKQKRYKRNKWKQKLLNFKNNVKSANTEINLLKKEPIYEVCPKFVKNWKMKYKWLSLHHIFHLFKVSMKYKGFKYLKKQIKNLKLVNNFGDINIFYFYIITIIRLFKQLTSKREFVEEILSFICIYFTLKPFLNFLSSFLKGIFNTITDFSNILIKYYIISNDNITAFFLAKYLARKLKKNFTVFSIMIPLFKELNRLISYSEASIYIKELLPKNNDYFTKALFRRLIMILILFFNIDYYSYYNKYSNWITMDYFLLLLNNNDKYLSNEYFKIKAYLNFLYRINFKVINKFYLSSLTHDKDGVYFNSNKNILFELILQNISTVYDNSIYLTIFDNINIFFKGKALNIVMYFYNNYIHYNYSKFIYNYKLLYNNLTINKAKKRLKIKKNVNFQYNGIILGYKIAFYGRFTRKQRAASLVFYNGITPLNSMHANIDYSFYTIPLINSAVGVKVWLYRNVKADNWSYRI